MKTTKKALLLMAAGATLFASAPAFANRGYWHHPHARFVYVAPAPVYYAPPPVYVAPAPAYYVPPAPVVVPPVVYPAPAVSFGVRIGLR